MKRAIVRRLQAVEQLLRTREFHNALAEIRRIDITNSSPQEKAHVFLLECEAKLYLGQYDIEAQLSCAVNYFKYTNENAQFAQAKFLEGLLLISRGNFVDAKEALLESYVSYKRCDDRQGQARALNRLGFIAYHIGEVEQSVAHLRKSISLYEEQNESKSAASVALNLAQLLFAMGRLRESTQYYHEIALMIRKQGSKSTALFYFMSSIPLAMKLNFASAHQTIKKALPYLKDFVREQAIYYENLGWIHLLEEDYPAAEKALLQGLEISLRIAPESALVSQIKRRLADACFGQAKYDEAQKYTDEGLAVAEKIGERVEIAACWRVYAQLENRRGHQSTARGWFAKAIDIFSMIGSRYELAATRYLAAVSGVYQNGERQALLYLARAYFESEEVAPYLTKIDRALKKLPSLPPRTVGQAPTIIAESAAMRKLIDLARHVAQSDMSVLLTGPTGTGKDLLADYIHYHSGRTGKFMPVNTAAIPDTMVEAELFGHRKGAFTGADRDKAGLIDQAAGGTLYLNEIADSSLEFQAKLLDVLERRRVRPLGGRDDHPVDFRLIAASNRDLAELVRQNKFRADLYHRLNQVNLALPPLDDRKEDIPPLVRHFLAGNGIMFDAAPNKALTKFTTVFASRQWEGNVRALKAEVDYLALTCKGDFVRMAAMAAVRALDTASYTECDRLLQLLEETNWNRREVARRLGISEGKVRYQIVKYGLNCTIKS